MLLKVKNVSRKVVFRVFYKYLVFFGSVRSFRLTCLLPNRVVVNTQIKFFFLFSSLAHRIIITEVFDPMMMKESWNALQQSNSELKIWRNNKIDANKKICLSTNRYIRTYWPLVLRLLSFWHLRSRLIHTTSDASSKASTVHCFKYVPKSTHHPFGHTYQ